MWRGRRAHFCSFLNSRHFTASPYLHEYDLKPSFSHQPLLSAVPERIRFSLSVFAFQLLSARCCGATADSIEPRCSVILSIRGFTDALFCFRQLQFKVYVLPLELLNFHAVFEGRCLTPWMLCECFYPFRSQSTLCTSIRSAGTCQLVFSCCLYVLNYRCSEVMAGSCSTGADKDLGCSGKEKWWFSKDCLHTGRNRKL